MIYAEVIGDPIAQSKSPLIHKHWLQRLGIEGDYQKTRVAAPDLPVFVNRRRADPDWCGCNVTIPHKQAIIPLLDRVHAGAAAIGAVNCVVSEGDEFVGYNTDIDGVAAALDSTELQGRTVAVIGAGGGARAVVAYLGRRDVNIRLLARNPEKADELQALARVEVLPLGAERALEGAAVIVNATSMGMVGADPMPQPILDAVLSHAARATVFDMVTTPVDTPFLRAAREGGGHTVDGLTMLVGQARRAFELFFGAPAPEGDEPLRNLLTTDSSDSA